LQLTYFFRQHLSSNQIKSSNKTLALNKTITEWGDWNRGSGQVGTVEIAGGGKRGSGQRGSGKPGTKYEGGKHWSKR